MDILKLHNQLLEISSKRVKEAGIPTHVLGGILGAGALGLGAYQLGKATERSNSVRNRNLAFGAGLAAGAIAPDVVRRGTAMLKNIGQVLGSPNFGATPGFGPPGQYPYQ